MLFNLFQKVVFEKTLIYNIAFFFVYQSIFLILKKLYGRYIKLCALFQLFYINHHINLILMNEIKLLNLEIQRLKQKILTLQRQNNALLLNIKNYKEKISILEEKNNFYDLDFDVNSNADLIFKNIIENKGKHPNARRYIHETLSFCFELKTISEGCYEIFRKVFPIPSIKTLKNYFGKKINKLTKSFGDRNKIPLIFIDELKKYGIQNKIIDGILTVDAISFRPKFDITKDGIIEGFDYDKISKNDLNIDFNEICKTPQKIEEFISNNWKNIFSNLFVFQFQPFNEIIKPFPIYVKKATNGKTNNDIIQTLFDLQKLLLNFNGRVIGFSFDGDTGYSDLNYDFFAMYDNLIFSSDSHFVPFNTLIIPDFLHLMKRARYRIVSSDIRIGYKEKYIDVKISDFEKKLNLPKIVFNNCNLTKMHDSLPLELFSIKSFLTLYDNSVVGAYLYSFPFTMQIISLKNSILNSIERLFCLETAFYFLYIYFKIKVNYLQPIDTSEKRTNKKFLTYLTDNFLIEQLNELYSVISIMLNYDGKILLDRCSTSPLEHLFGRCRLKCKNIDTIEKFLRTLACNHQNNSVQNIINIDIRGRKLNDSTNIECPVIPHKLFSFSPYQLAIAIWEIHGFDFSEIYQDMYTEYIQRNKYEIVNVFVKFLHEKFDPEIGHEKKYHTMNQLMLGVNKTMKTKTIFNEMSKIKNKIFQ